MSDLSNKKYDLPDGRKWRFQETKSPKTERVVELVFTREMWEDLVIRTNERIYHNPEENVTFSLWDGEDKSSEITLVKFVIMGGDK